MPINTATGRLIALGAAFVGLVTGNLSRAGDSNSTSHAFAVAGWPHLRGPTYNGSSAETGLMDSWPTEGLPILWKIDIGHEFSGFVVDGKRIYTQAQTLTGQYVLCLDANTGAKIWDYKYDWPYEAAGVYPGPRSTPTLADGRVYATGPRGMVVCLQASDGQEVWAVNVKSKFKGQGTDFGYASSPLVEAGKVILPVGGVGASVVALDAATGATVWKSGDEPASYSSAIPIVFQAQRQILVLLKNALAAFDPRDGRILWQEQFSSGYEEHSTFPIYAEPFVMVASPFHEGAKLFRIESDSSRVKQVWESQAFSQDVASSVLVDGFVYGFDLHDVQVKVQRPSRGEFKCLEFQTGKVCWATDKTGHATVIAADGKLILFNDQGELILVRDNAAKYEELGRVTVFPGEFCWTAPSLDHGRLYLRTQTHAACLNLAKAKLSVTSQHQIVAPQTDRQERGKSNTASWWLGAELDYLFEPPELNDFTRWFSISLFGVIGISAVIAVLAGTVLRKPYATFIVFSAAAFILGMIAMPVLNRLLAKFVFTWCVSLFAMFQATLVAILWAEQQPDRKRSRRISRLVGLIFLGVCFAYYVVCRNLSLVMEWTFLIGFIPASPFAYWAARQILRAPRHPANFFWLALSFAAYFWGSSGFLYLR